MCQRKTPRISEYAVAGLMLTEIRSALPGLPSDTTSELTLPPWFTSTSTRVQFAGTKSPSANVVTAAWADVANAASSGTTRRNRLNDCILATLEILAPTARCQHHTNWGAAARRPALAAVEVSASADRARGLPG